jgi:hypothetical protein
MRLLTRRGLVPLLALPTLIVSTTLCAAQDAWDWASDAWEEMGGPAGVDGSDIEDACDHVDLLRVLMRDAAALRANPLDLNSATASELSRVPGLDPADAAAIVAFRAGRAPIESVEDLLESPRFTNALVASLRPYVTCATRGAPGTHDASAAAGGGPPRARSAGVRAATIGASLEAVRHGPRVTAWSLRARSSWRLGIDDAWALESGQDLGRAATAFARLRASGDLWEGRGGLWKAGASLERDAWESSLLDHTAFHLTWESAAEGVGAHRVSAIVGHVLVDWGQGLVLSGRRFATPAGFPRRSDRARGYDGAGEVFARTGLHASAGRGVVDVQLLATLTRLDASIDESGLAVSIRTSGHHRTESELDGRRSLSERCVAARVVATPLRGASVGCSALSLTYEPGLARGDPKRQRYRFHGDALTAFAVDLRSTWDEAMLGAEAAVTSFGGRALVVSGRVRSGRARARIGFGHLSREFWLPQGGGVPGVSGGANGTSAWLSLEFEPARGARLNAEFGVRGRPWRSYTNELPDVRRSAEIGCSVRVGGLGTLSAELRARRERSDCVSPDDETPEVEPLGGPASESISESTRRTRVSFTTDGDEPLSVAITNAVVSREETETGRSSAVSVRWDVGFGDAGLLSLGVTSSTVRDSAPRDVAYEPGLPGEFSLRALNASGTRWYIRLKAGVSSSVGLSARLSGGPGRGDYAFGFSLDLKG